MVKEVPGTTVEPAVIPSNKDADASDEDKRMLEMDTETSLVHSVRDSTSKPVSSRSGVRSR